MNQFNQKKMLELVLNSEPKSVSISTRSRDGIIMTHDDIRDALDEFISEHGYRLSFSVGEVCIYIYRNNEASMQNSIDTFYDGTVVVRLG